MIRSNAGIVAILAVLAVLGSFSSAAFNATQVISAPDSGYVVSNYQQTPDRIFPGDGTTLKLDLASARSSASEVFVTVNTPFLSKDAAFYLGDLDTATPRTISVAFSIPATTKAGTYPLYVYARDANTPQKEIARVQLVVTEPTLQGLLLARVSSNQSIHTGQSAAVDIDLANTGALDAHDVTVEIVSNASKPFTSLETDRRYVKRISSGTAEPVNFTLGVAADAAPGYYPLTIDIHYSVDNVPQPVQQQQLGLRVDANAQLLISGEAQGTALSVTIANVGDTAVRGVYARAESNAVRFTGASDKFIGTLNLDDTASMALNFVPRGTPGADAVVSVVLTYKDAANQEHTLRKNLPLTNGFEGTAENGALANGANAGTAGNQRFLRTRNSGFFGLEWWQWIALLALAGAGAWYYRKRQKSKKEGKK